ncbi:MAG: CAP domain-containing protein [Beijerinckiaceae bacterium]
MLELINAERAKAGAQPLAFNGDLNEASEQHSMWMIAADVFSHTGSGGSSAGQRMTAAGYAFTGSWGWGENIAWATTRSPSGLQDEVLLMHNSLMNSSGHRANILNASYREVGIGVESGDYGGRDGAFITQDFARSGSGNFLTGVAFDDKDGDRFYDVGEGLGGLTLTAVNIATGQQFVTTTWDAGGYSLALAAGSYTVTFSGGGFTTTTSQATIGGSNVKLDLVDPTASGTPTPPTPPTPPAENTIVGTSAGETIHGTANRDIINGLGGGDRLYGENGDDQIDGGSGSDYLFGGAGADALIGGEGGDRLYGGASADVMTGGAGQDRYIFDTAPVAGQADRITDFSTTDDLIWLENRVFTGLGSSGSMSSSAYWSGAAAHDSSDRVIYNQATGALLYDADGTGQIAAVKIADLAPGLAMSSSDFQII